MKPYVKQYGLLRDRKRNTRNNNNNNNKVAIKCRH